MWFDSIGYEFQTEDGTPLGSGPMTEIKGVDLTGPRENWSIFSTASLQGQDIPTKIILVVKLSRFTYEASTASSIHTYLRVGESKYTGVALTRAP